MNETPTWTDTLSSFFDSASNAYAASQYNNSQPPVGGLSPYGVPYGAYGPGTLPQSSGITTLLLLVMLGAIFFFAFGRSK